jgi:hypothetical protein
MEDEARVTAAEMSGIAAARKRTLPTRASAPLQIAEEKLRNQWGP